MIYGKTQGPRGLSREEYLENELSAVQTKLVELSVALENKTTECIEFEQQAKYWKQQYERERNAKSYLQKKSEDLSAQLEKFRGSGFWRRIKEWW